MAFLGMDVEQVRQLARQMDAKAQTIDEIVSTLSSQLQSTDWKGSDADQFRNQWNSDLTTKLRQVSQALKEASQTATRNAQVQDSTSASL